jgi:hypothetical protein
MLWYSWLVADVEIEGDIPDFVILGRSRSEAEAETLGSMP